MLNASPYLIGEPSDITARDTRAATMRDAAVRENLGLAHRIAARYMNRGVDIEDLQQVAALALVLASRRFDPELGYNFSAFAAPTIHGELKRHLRDHAWAVRPPRALHDRYHEVVQASRSLEQTLGREPSPQDIASHLGMGIAQVREAQRVGCSYTASSLEALTAERPDSPLGATVASGSVHDAEASVVAIMLDQTLEAQASSRERLLLRLRFEQDLTQQEIGNRLGISQMQVSRLLSCVLARLRAGLAETMQYPAA